MTTPKYSIHTSLYILNANYSSAQDILVPLKKKNRHWSLSRFINIAMYKFLKDFPKKNDEELKALFDEYDEAMAIYKEIEE